jgi:SAM-dependent methyltransferase
MATQGRALNSAITRMWSFLAPAYDLPVLQQWVYRPPHDEVIAQLRAHQSRRIADIACGTGILSDRIERELHPDEIYGIDMSDGMLNQARARSNRVHRPAPCPSTGEDSDLVRPDYRRHQELRVRAINRRIPRRSIP